MAKSRAQQAAIAISMKSAGKSPKKMSKGGKSSYMERMRMYQAGGLMYGDPKLGDQTVSNIVYGDYDRQMMDRYKEQIRETEQDTSAMDEATAQLEKQAATVGAIETAGQSALQAGVKGLAKKAATNSVFTPSVDIAAEAGTNLVSKSPGMFGKLGQSVIANANPQHFAKVSPYAIAGNLAGQGIKYLSDDQDATTMNFGEGFGSTLSGAAAGAGYGSMLGPVGTAVGAGVGALYGLGKGLYQRNQARSAMSEAEQEKQSELDRIGAEMRAEGIKSREYSGYDFGRTLAKNGGPRMYQTAGFDMSMLANNNLPSAYNLPDAAPHTVGAAPEKSFMSSVHKFAQNPITEIQRAANITPGGVTGRNTMDYAVDLINLPGAVSKVIQGASKGDPTKTAAGLVQALPYAKPIAKTIGAGARLLPGAEVAGAEIAALENAGVEATHAYKAFADKTLNLGKEPSKYVMKGIVKNAPVDSLAMQPTQDLPTDPRLSGVTAQESTRVNMPVYRFKAGGVKLPGGTMKPIPGSDAVEFKGRPHSKGGILLDQQTEVEGGETMDKVTMKNGGPSDYFFSKYLKLGGKSYAQRHKDILKNGGSQQDIDALAKSQEMAAGRNPGLVQMESGGAYKYQLGGDPTLTNNDYSNPPLGDISSMSLEDLQKEIQRVGADPRLNTYAKDKQLTALYGAINSKGAGTTPDVAPAQVGYNPVPQGMGFSNEIPGYQGNDFRVPADTKPKPAPAPKTTPKATAPTPAPAPAPVVDELPDLVYEDTQLEAIPEEADTEVFLTKEQLDAKKVIEEKVQNDIPLTKEEQRALKNMYRDVPVAAQIAGAAQMIPAAYAFLRKEKAQKLMGPAGRIGSPKLERADFNAERSQNAADARAISKSIETSGSGPAGIIAKMAAYGKKQAGDMQIAASESRANAGIQAQEAQMAQRANMANVQNAMAIDQINTRMIEAQRVADENRRYMALDAAAKTGAGLVGDVLSYKADERVARSLGTMGIYERERLGRSLLGKINPRTGKAYTKADIAKLYNINLDDPGITREAEAAKTKSEE